VNLKQFKPIHWIYNLLHYKELQHNIEPFKKFKRHKSLVASISSRDFPDQRSQAWLDTGHSKDLAPSSKMFSRFSPSVQSKILSWSDNGYLILENFLPPDTCDLINMEIDRLLQSKSIHFSNGNKLMFAHKKSALIRDVAKKKELLDILQFLLAKEVQLFQTINFLKGSEQKAHSDSIHMTTYPLGYLLAGWLALEDAGKENGPLFYYPGSHIFPYLLNKDFNQGETALTLGRKGYADYEDLIEKQIHENNLEKKEFYAKKGDLLIWHANLLHGGSPIADKSSSRKSMVMHYFARDVIKYHDITERPSLMNEPD
jgi:ectoine hydroxylase